MQSILVGTVRLSKSLGSIYNYKLISKYVQAWPAANSRRNRPGESSEEERASALLVGKRPQIGRALPKRRCRQGHLNLHRLFDWRNLRLRHKLLRQDEEMPEPVLWFHKRALPYAVRMHQPTHHDCSDFGSGPARYSARCSDKLLKRRMQLQVPAKLAAHPHRRQAGMVSLQNDVQMLLQASQMIVFPFLYNTNNVQFSVRASH